MQSVAPDRANGRPTLLVCGFDAGDGTAAELLRRLSDDGRGPVRSLTVPPSWREAAETILKAAAESLAAGVLLFDLRPQAGVFEVLMRAENVASRRRRDGEGVLFGRERISPIGPGVARATAPVAAMVRALQAEGLPVRASSDAGDDLVNYALYRMLTEYDGLARAPDVGAVFAPGRLGEGGPPSPLSTLEAGLRAAVGAFVNALPPVRAYA